MKHVVVGPEDARIGYVDHPGIEPVRIFLHGLGSSSAAYFSAIAADPIAGGHRSLLMDFLGFGFSDRPQSFGYGLEDQAAAIGRALDALGVREADVVGHSMGGSIAIVLASIRPDLVARLVVAEPNLAPSRRPRIEGFTEATFVETGFARALERVGGHWAATMRLADPVALYRSERALGEAMPTDLRQRLLALPIPRTLVVGGASPSIGGEGEMDAAGVSRVVIPNAGHNMMLDDPEAFVAALARAFA